MVFLGLFSSLLRRADTNLLYLLVIRVKRRSKPFFNCIVFESAQFQPIALIPFATSYNAHP